MNIKIHSLHFDADVKLLQFIESKINKLDHFYDSIIGAEVTLRIEHSNDAENKVIETKILIPAGFCCSCNSWICLHDVLLATPYPRQRGTDYTSGRHALSIPLLRGQGGGKSLQLV